MRNVLAATALLAALVLCERPLAAQAMTDTARIREMIEIATTPGVVESAFRVAEQLNLSDAQRRQLETLRQDVVKRRSEILADLIRLQSSLLAGRNQDDRFDVQRQRILNTMRSSSLKAASDLRAILTKEQFARLLEMGAAKLREQGSHQ